MNAQRVLYYVGYSEGRPHRERVRDEYGYVYHVELFTSIVEARRRYQDVRVAVVEFKGEKPRRRK